MRLNIQIRLAVCFLFPLFALASGDFTIYLVKNRPAEEMVKVAGSVFQGKANITSSNEKIIISADKRTTAKVIALLEELDQKTRSLRVSLRWKENTRGNENQKSLSGEVGGKNWGVKNSPTPAKGGATVSVGGVKGNISESSGEGRHGGIESVLISGNGEGSIALADFEQGTRLKVKARSMSTDLVNLDIEQVGRNGESIGSLKTSLTLKLNQWKTLGSVNKSSQGRQSEILGRKDQSGSSQKELEILVEQAPE